MKDQILQAFKARQRDLKEYQIEKAVDKYIQVMLRAIASSIANFGFANSELSLSIVDLREEIGKIRIQDKQQWIINLMHANEQTALVLTNFKGNKGKNSRVSLNPIYEKQIMEKLINLNYELSESRVKELSARANVWVTAQPDCIDDFIAKTLEKYVEIENDQKMYVYREALARNMLIAGQIKSQIVTKDGESLLPEHWEATDSGRMYGHGLSLQRVPKHVRHAALGLCHQYDFKASSFGLMTSLALQIDPRLKVADLSDYIKHRARIRTSIAKEIGVTENKIKDVFTSLGFGATTANNPFSSIRGSMSSEQYEGLMANVQFKHIRQAMELVRETVANHYSDAFTFMGRNYDKFDPKSDPTKPKKRTKNQKLAWIYQVMESNAITMFGEIAADNGYIPLLFAHDCAYFKHPLPGDLLNSIMYELNRTFPMLRVEHSKVVPIHKTGAAFRDLVEYEELAESHKAFIDTEELAVSDGPSDPLDPVDGYFSREIKELNNTDGRAGKSINLNG